MVHREAGGDQITVESLWRYPVKGLSGQQLTQVKVLKGQCFPCDRIYAIENGPGLFDPKIPKFLPKINFLCRMRDERLALLDIAFDEESHCLIIKRQGRPVATGDLSTSLGCNMIEQFFAAFMEKELKGPPKIQFAAEHNFTDKAEKLVHIINLDSVKALGSMLNESLHPARFRANIHFKGGAPFAEKNWVGKTLIFGAVKIEIVSLTKRCAAVNVDPETAKRGKSLPLLLQQEFGDENFGLYGRILNDGVIEQGQNIFITG